MFSKSCTSYIIRIYTRWLYNLMKRDSQAVPAGGLRFEGCLLYTASMFVTHLLTFIIIN